MASIRQRSKNTWAVIYQNGEGDDRHQEWESGYTKNQAKARKAEIEREEALGIKTHVVNEEHYSLREKSINAAQVNKAQRAFNPIDEQAKSEIPNDGDGLLLKPFMEEFIRIYGIKKWGTSYYQSSSSLLENYVYDYWQGVPITKFTVKAIDKYYVWLITECPQVDTKYNQKSGEFVTASTVNDIHKILRCAFNRAKKWQHIDSNPFLDSTVPEYKSEERPALTPDEIDRVLKYTDNPNAYDLYLIHCAMNLAFAGSMRGGEVGGLQWEDIVDPQRRILYTHKAIDRVDKQALEKVNKTKVYFKFPSSDPRSKSVVVLKNTKEDGGSDRNAYLPEMVYSKIMKLREMQEELKIVLGDSYYDYGMMICQENGKPVMTEHLNKRFQKVLNEMGIKPKHGEKQYVFHSIRSTATTYKLRVSGGDIKAVQGENGQKDPKMVTHQYSRIIDEDRIRIANAMNDDFYRKDERKSEEEELLSAVKNNPELFKQFVAFMSMTKNSANNIA